MTAPPITRSKVMNDYCRAGVMVILVAAAGIQSHAHEGHHDDRFASSQPSDPSSSPQAVTEARHAFDLLTSLVAKWPTAVKDDLIRQAYLEHQFIHGDPDAVKIERLRQLRQQTMNQLASLLPSATIVLSDHGSTLADPKQQLQLSRGLESPLLCRVINRSNQPRAIRIAGIRPQLVPANADLPVSTRVESGSETWFLSSLRVPPESEAPERMTLQLESQPDVVSNVSIPVRVTAPATLQIELSEQGTPVAGRVTVQCSDGVCRLAGEYAENSTLTEKPIVYPPIGTSQRMPFVYSDGPFTVSIPAGKTIVTAERGFEHRRRTVEATLKPGQSKRLALSCERLVDMAADGWISGDTHVHWVTNAWNVDEPLQLLSMVQRAEDLRVANNLTLLQRYANQAFIKPSQAAMGPVKEFSDSSFHIQMGEEYRNEDLYGHLCFLNIDWLVQPIGTGSIIAGPDALDYPINRTAIDACRGQGGISIEAHGTGGNKDVPVNVIHNLSNSLDQMEPELYYRLLDCGFRIPLTNGSDHPARPLGIARAYVKIDGQFSYDRWIEGIRRGRTFTTSGPLLFLTVNEADIGDQIHAGPTQRLRIRAKVVSRDRVGTFQVLSNGEVLAEKVVDATTAVIDLEIPAQESRWIVARCSNRSEGRADFGFGNFNAITGPGVAHTSPVYVQVDRTPRFNPDAAQYWIRRMREHSGEILVRGRFANDTQRKEAVGYIQQGIRMFRQLPSQLESARSNNEDWRAAKKRITNVLRRFGAPDVVTPILDTLAKVRSPLQLHQAVEPLVLLSASLNPESRVKISATRNQIELRQGRPQRFLVSVENTAGSTAPLQIQTIDIASDPPAEATWCDVEIVDSPFTSAFLTGAPQEYKVVELLVREGGLKEVRLIANVGQGTQDLGFRATADLLIDSNPGTIATEKSNE